MSSVPERVGIPEDLGRTSARGAGVTLAAQVTRMALQFVSVAALARLLSPADYGLLAVGLVVVGLGEVVRDFGLSTAALRAPVLTTGQRDGLFWINAAAGSAMALVAVVAAGPLATAFGQPELELIIRVLGLTFVLNGLAAQYRAGLSRDLRFTALAGSDVTAQAISLVVALTAAVLGAGYWALVAQQMSQVTVLLVSAVMLARWVPGRPRRGVGLRPLLRFGAGITGTQIVYFVGSNLDNLSLGLWVGPAGLGLYNRALQLLMSPLNQLRSPATTLAVPVLSKLHDDSQRFGEYLRRSQLAFGYPLVTALALVAGAAGPVVELVLGSRWAAVTPVVALLAIAGSAQTLAFVGHWVYVARGLSGALMRFHLVSLLLSAVCILGGTPFGVVGVAAGYAIAALLEWPLSLWWLSRVTVIPVRELLQGALRITACAAMIGGTCRAAVELCDGWPSIGRILVGTLAGLAVYGAAALVPVVREDLRGVLAWAAQMAGRSR